jgi:hypothetical protein
MVLLSERESTKVLLDLTPIPYRGGADSADYRARRTNFNVCITGLGFQPMCRQACIGRGLFCNKPARGHRIQLLNTFARPHPIISKLLCLVTGWSIDKSVAEREVQDNSGTTLTAKSGVHACSEAQRTFFCFNKLVLLFKQMQIACINIKCEPYATGYAHIVASGGAF